MKTTRFAISSIMLNRIIPAAVVISVILLLIDSLAPMYACNGCHSWDLMVRESSGLFTLFKAEGGAMLVDNTWDPSGDIVVRPIGISHDGTYAVIVRIDSGEHMLSVYHLESKYLRSSMRLNHELNASIYCPESNRVVAWRTRTDFDGPVPKTSVASVFLFDLEHGQVTSLHTNGVSQIRALGCDADGSLAGRADGELWLQKHSRPFSWARLLRDRSPIGWHWVRVEQGDDLPDWVAEPVGSAWYLVHLEDRIALRKQLTPPSIFGQLYRDYVAVMSAPDKHCRRTLTSTKPLGPQDVFPVRNGLGVQLAQLLRR